MPAVLRAARPAAVALAGALAAWGLASCGGGQTVPGANASRGRQLVQYYGCGACHTIGGIDTANGTVGPKLTNFSSIRYITGGDLPNTPANAERWIEHPHQYRPDSIMPDMGVTPEQAADIVAYLEGQ